MTGDQEFEEIVESVIRKKAKKETDASQGQWEEVLNQVLIT